MHRGLGHDLKHIDSEEDFDVPDSRSSHNQCKAEDSIYFFRENAFVTQQNKRPSVICYHNSFGDEIPLLIDTVPRNREERKDAMLKKSNEVRHAKRNVESKGAEDFALEEADEPSRPKKRHRSSFNSSQLKRLEEEFEGDNYIIGMKRWRLSNELNISEKQIKVWFQNRRTKSRKLEGR